jgi:hypothetical protein
MTAAVEFPYPGIQVHQNPRGARVVRLHWTADPTKAVGKSVYVDAIKRAISPWAYGEFLKMSSAALYLQEYEIDASATLGALLYSSFEAEATLVDPFPIPEDWTRTFVIDPHPRVPHCSLWGAVDRYGDGWIYREYWPSKVYGIPGNIPEDDNRVRIKEYCEVIQWLESAQNPENRTRDDKRFDEHIYKRVIDYAARGFGQGTSDDDGKQPNFQERFEKAGYEIAKEKGVRFRMSFEDAKKDHDVGIELVNDWLKPTLVEASDGTFKPWSKLHIFKTCQELIYQLKTNRWKQNTAIQAEIQDPQGRPVPKRNHGTDCLRYWCMSKPVYVERKSHPDTFQPVVPGIAY